MNTKQSTALIDADMLVFQIAAACEEPTHWGDDIWTLHSDAREAISKAEEKIESILEASGCDRAIMCFSDPTGRYWRHDLEPNYKGHRDSRKPVCYWPLREHLCDEYDHYVRPGLEADDVIGILATNKKVVPGYKVIVSGDKDFKTIPAPFLNLDKLDQEVTEAQSLETADYWHLYQTLTGDTTDGYPGCPGVGPVKAEKILNQAEGPWWDAVIEAFSKAGLDEHEALRQARLARICRASDYDFRNKKVKLWTPPQE